MFLKIPFQTSAKAIKFCLFFSWQICHLLGIPVCHSTATLLRQKKVNTGKEKNTKTIINTHKFYSCNMLSRNYHSHISTYSSWSFVHLPTGREYILVAYKKKYTY